MSRKLLLADDSITIQKVIGITFVNEDFDLTVVDNGDAALEQARAERPDLILADVFMPGKNGYELCAAVKADPALAGVPVLLLTGTFEPFDEGKANSAGADGWIAKPFESQALIARVLALLDKAATPLVAPIAPPPIVEAAVEEIETYDIAAVAPEAEIEADLWEDFDEVVATVDVPMGAVAAVETEPADADFGDIFGSEEEEPSSETTADDIWGDVSFEDEDLAAEAGAVESSDLEDIWAPQEEVPSEPSSAVAEEEPFDFALEPETEIEPVTAEPSAAEIESDDLFVFEEEEAGAALAATSISEGDDFFVVEEEPLLAEVLEAADSVEEEELMELGEEDILFLEEAEILDEEEFGFASTAEATDDDFLLLEGEGESVPSDVLEESALTDEDLFGDLAVLAVPEAEISEPETVTPEPEMVIPAAVEAMAAESKVRTLSDAELEAIVEKVAGAVIERLAGAILEKIAWEVVPDLAETLIKEEIRQIKEDVR
jgi:DNA-binding response OmpR family regulator